MSKTQVKTPLSARAYFYQCALLFVTLVLAFSGLSHWHLFEGSMSQILSASAGGTIGMAIAMGIQEYWPWAIRRINPASPFLPENARKHES
jgi:hypothetical protein